MKDAPTFTQFLVSMIDALTDSYNDLLAAYQEYQKTLYQGVASVDQDQEQARVSYSLMLRRFREALRTFRNLTRETIYDYNRLRETGNINQQNMATMLNKSLKELRDAQKAVVDVVPEEDIKAKLTPVQFRLHINIDHLTMEAIEQFYEVNYCLSHGDADE